MTDVMVQTDPGWRQPLLLDRWLSEYVMIAPLEVDILMGLARFGRMLTRQIKAIWFAQQTLRHVQNVLNKLLQKNLIRRAMLYEPAQNMLPPNRHGWFYTITEEAERILTEAYPSLDLTTEKLTRSRDLTWQGYHQMNLADFVQQLIAGIGCIPGLVGINGATEIVLGPEIVPRCDALITVRRWCDARTAPAAHGPQNLGTYVPWLLHERLPHQQVDRWYALEIDRATEPAEYIVRKARDYRGVAESRYWVGRYPWPLPVWVVPSDGRMELVVREWRRMWPEMSMFITTHDRLMYYGIDGPIWTFCSPRGTNTQYDFFNDWRHPAIPDPDARSEERS